MELITSRKNPLIARLRKLSASRSERREQGLFLCDGTKLLAEAVAWAADIETLVLTQGSPVPPVRDNCRVVEVPEDVMRSISPMDAPQGALFLCGMPRTDPPEKLSGRRYLVLDGLQDPGNVGTVWRTADAFGADGVFLLPGCADPFSPKTVRATMGAVFRLPLWETDLDTLRALLAEANIPLYATALRQDTVDVRQADLSRAAVVIGSEGGGVSGAVLESSEKTLRIPMTDRCESLNAAAAAAVVLWEMFR